MIVITFKTRESMLLPYANKCYDLKTIFRTFSHSRNLFWSHIPLTNTHIAKNQVHKLKNNQFKRISLKFKT